MLPERFLASLLLCEQALVQRLLGKSGAMLIELGGKQWPTCLKILCRPKAKF